MKNKRCTREHFHLFPFHECIVFLHSHSYSTDYVWFRSAASTMHYLLLVQILSSINAQSVRDAYMTLTSPGYEFQPINASVQLLSTRYATSSLRCAHACVSTLGCRTFDYDRSNSSRCRLYEADQITGKSIPSVSSSIVGSMLITSKQFTSFNRTPCNTHCSGNSYLSCNANDTCVCATQTYWDGAVCQLQKLTGASCTTNSECRGDLSLVCLQFFQCGREYH